MHRSEFLAELKALFPELKNKSNKECGLLHFEINVFKNFTQRAIYEGEREKVSLCFEFANRVYVEGNGDLRDAIDVSFVEILDFESTPKRNAEWAWNCFPEELKSLYNKFHCQ